MESFTRGLVDSAPPHLVIDHVWDRIRQERAARTARVDEFSVDRSRLHGLVLPWSPEAEAREQKYEAIRRDVTLVERVEAWRVFFAMTVDGRSKR